MDLIRRDGQLWHQSAPDAPEERIIVDACGTPLPGCLHPADEPTVATDEAGHVAMQFGGQLVSMPAEVAVRLAGALLQHIPAATDARLSAEFTAKREQALA